MRLGGPILDPKPTTPDEWIAAHQARGYRAAYCPVTPETPADDVAAYVNAAQEHDIVLAEVGSWCNLIGPDEAERERNIAQTVAKVQLADQVGARCCVDIAGSLSPEQWNGPHPQNYAGKTFDRIVTTVRRILEEADPKQAKFTLEMMAWGYPDSAETYLELIEAIDHPQFGVHFDPVNLCSTPRRYLANGRFLRETVEALRDHIVSVHAKDVILHGNHLVHLDECAPGEGALDWAAVLQELDGIDEDLPIMMEHLRTEEAYAGAATYLRRVAKEVGVEL